MMRAKNIARKKKVLCFNPTGAIIPNQEEQEQEGSAPIALNNSKRNKNVPDPHHHRQLSTQEAEKAQGVHALDQGYLSKWWAMKLSNSPFEGEGEGELETQGPPSPILCPNGHLSENESLLPSHRQRNHGKFQETLQGTSSPSRWQI